MPHTFSVGEVLTAANLNGIGAFTTWTPTVKFGATTATVANDSRYAQIGKTVVAHLKIRFTNLNSGTGTLTVTRPVTGHAPDTSVGQTYDVSLGTALFFDTSGAAVYNGFVKSNLADQSDFGIMSIAAPGASWSNTVPVTVAVGALNTGDELSAIITYEAA